MVQKFAITGCVVLFSVVSAAQAQDAPEMPLPQDEHRWLDRFVGQWESEVEASFDPEQPPISIRGTETVRPIGGFWIVAEGHSEARDMPFHHVLTLGYDAEKQKYVGTWIDSMSGHLWKYEGTVDQSGNVLVLDTEGPCPRTPGRTSKVREVTEFKSDDHRVFTSSVQDEAGQWSTVITGSALRVQ